jgi:hypothetical protein
LRRVRVLHVSRLRLESRRHASTLSRTVAELVVGGVSHLLVVVGVETATATAALRLEVASTGAVTLSGVARLAAEVGAGL